jgi:hypothetical protein
LVNDAPPVLYEPGVVDGPAEPKESGTADYETILREWLGEVPDVEFSPQLKYMVMACAAQIMTLGYASNVVAPGNVDTKEELARAETAKAQLIAALKRRIDDAGSG